MAQPEAAATRVRSSRAIGPAGTAARIAVGLALVGIVTWVALTGPVSPIAGGHHERHCRLLWHLPAGRGAARYAGCEVLAISNWLLRRDDQIGCLLFAPIDHLERRRTSRCSNDLH